MGTTNSTPHDAPPPAASSSAKPSSPTPLPPQPGPSTKREMINDNAFKGLPKFYQEDAPQMAKAMTFDERNLLNRKPNPYGIGIAAKGPNLKRAVTFVDKKKIQRRHSFALEDVMYRKHFGNDIEKRFPSIPIHEIPLGQIKDQQAAPLRDEAVVIVDTFSTGMLLAYLCHLKGFHVISVTSGDLESLKGMIPEGLDFAFAGTLSYPIELDENSAFESLTAQLSAFPWPIVAILPGAETGVELADQLSSHFGLRTNGTAQSEARRNKYVMGETVRSAGIRAVKQLESHTWSDIAAFLQDWQPDPYRVIVKPMDSAGSDDVTLCRSQEEVQRAFGHILGKVNGLGLVNNSVLVQEYLEGQEYVVDMVSRDGEHKLVGIWEYDRRPANGASFVCHGQWHRVVSDDPDYYGQIVNYEKGVCTALGIRNGPSHGEVKWYKDAPILVEVGSRCHGGDGLWVDVAEECLGHSQASMTVDVYLDPNGRFAALSADGTERLKFGALKFLITYEEGILKGYNEAYLDEIRKMKSYRGDQLFVKPGGIVKKTQNCFTWGGCVKLVHADEAQLKRDYYRIEEMEQSGLFVLDHTQVIPQLSYVGVVDPFSTGAALAAEIAKKGFKIIAIYSSDLEKLGNLQNLVPEGLNLSFESIVGYNEDLNILAGDIRKAAPRLVAILAGAETGVELADRLSSHFGLRTNGTTQSDARRNKYVMGETIRAAGIRAVKQLHSKSWDEVAAFLQDWQPDPYRVIVKPMDSAGSDDVTLCRSQEEVHYAFHHILGKVNGLGLVNNSVLVQEYLEGQEYVVDMVSRDGEHKLVAIWEYDRRPANGASFVMWGQQLMIMSDHPEIYNQLVEYQKRVITALGIRNGPSHGEVKWYKDAPILVEVGSRCHGSEGAWMPVSDGVLTYNQVGATVASFLSDDAFAQIPPLPTVRYQDGRLAFLICHKSGTVRSVNADILQEIRSLKSFVRMELFLKPGQRMSPTINCFTFGGVVVMVHPDADQVLRDYERVHELEVDLFEVE